MKGLLIKDWKQFDYSNPEHRATLGKNLGKFLSEPATNSEIKAVLAKIQEFGSAQDFPTSVLQVLDKYHLTTQYDTGWQSIYNVRDFTGSNRNGFDVSDVESGLTFNKIPIGDKLTVQKMWGTKAHVYFDYYGGALGWHRSLFDNQEYWTIEDNAIEFRNKAYLKQAQVFYALLEAVAATGAVAWQAHPDAVTSGTAGYHAGRDIATMNAAAQQILLAVANKGYGVTPGTASFIVLTPLHLQQRVKNALASTLQAFQGSTAQANFSFQPIITTMLADTAHAWVILPKHKLVAGMRMDLQMFASFDMLSYTDAAAGWMAYGGAIGDTDQVVRIAFA
jgi:extradiol dioxygenase family protein